MLMLGEQIRDIPGISFAIKKLNERMKNKSLSNRDYDYLNDYPEIEKDKNQI